MAKMLRSALFRDQERLQKAAVNHAYHVMKGDQGSYVARIQCFLLYCGIFEEVDSIFVEENSGFKEGFQEEFNNDYFGEWTEVMTLLYKVERDIVDRSRQTLADAIVGVMTIRRMDTEQIGIEANVPPVETRQQASSFAPTRYRPLVVAGPHALSRRIGS